MQNALLKWMQTTEGNNQIAEANKSKFISRATLESKGNVTAEIFFKESEGSLQSVFGSDRKY